MDYEIPDFYEYLNWYDLNTPVGIYNFMQEFLEDNNIEDYPDIKVYYEMLCESAFKEQPDMVVVDYVLNKLKNRLIKYGFAHTTRFLAVDLKKKAYFYWKQK